MTQGKAMPGRECGDCTMCCKLLEVKELAKPQAKWCAHCTPGKGCGMYAERPPSCRDFNCLWLQGFGDDSMRPDRSKVVMACTTDGTNLVFHVDPSRPDALLNPKFDRIIDGFIEDGKHSVFVVRGDKRTQFKRRAA